MAIKGPLRKVVREFSIEHQNIVGGISYGVTYRHFEELECGHVIRPRSDFYGEYYAYRRRCTECRQRARLERKAKGGV
jgi:hypothetical protein